MTAHKIKIFKDDDKKVDAKVTEEEFKKMSTDDKEKLALELFADLDEKSKADALKIIRLQSVLITANILDDYCANVKFYHDSIVGFIADNLPDKSFIDRLNAIDTFAEKEEYVRKLIELDISTATYMAERIAESNGVQTYDPMQMTMYQFSYSHWIEERNNYFSFFLTAFENELDKKAIEDIVKNNTSSIAEKISDYIAEHFETIEFSDNMGMPDFMGM